jgi:integrase
MLVHSCKTEHHPGGESRLVPIFPELLPHLRQAFEEAKPGTTFAVTRYRQTGCNLRTQLHRIIRKAGLVPWERTFQNLRATRETELCESFPLHVVTAWIGNSQIIAARHYLQVTDEHFSRAAQNRAQRVAESSAQNSNERKPTLTDSPENADLLVGAGACGPIHNHPH